MVHKEEDSLIIVVDVEKWLFVHKKEADEASIPTILVEKDIEGATWFFDENFVPIEKMGESTPVYPAFIL